MILNFKCRETKRIYNGVFSIKFPKDIQDRALKKLRMINAAIVINDLLVPPSNKLEILQGEMKGKYSIRINDKWRICFNFENQNASNVEIVDYH